MLVIPYFQVQPNIPHILPDYWATGRGFDPLGPTAAFLYELFDTHGLSPQTIKRYRSWLASLPSRTSRMAAVQVKTISDMIIWNCRGLD